MFKDLIAKYKEIKEKKFVKDGGWLVLSNLFMAICGILINVILSNRYGTEGFGAFSLGFKFYLVISLLAVFGCGASVVKHIAQFKADKDAVNNIVTSALLLSSVGSALFCLLAIMTIPFLTKVFHGPESNMFYYFLPGIFFFSWNKVLLSILNGTRSFKTLSVIQAVRWILLCLLIVLFAYVLNTRVEYIALTFAFTELALLPIGLYATRHYFNFTMNKFKEWIREHFSFGGKTMLSSAVIDLYNSTDVFMIGMFLNVKAVGIYAFASDIAKNLLVIANMIQVNFDPIIAEFWHNHKLTDLKEYIKRVRKYTYLIYLPVIILSIAGYFVFITNFAETDLSNSFQPFVILVIGIFFLSGFKPSYSLPSLCGFPADNLIINSIVLLTNIALNFILLQYWGINGVAIATASSYILSVFLLVIFVKRRLSIQLLN